MAVNPKGIRFDPVKLKFVMEREGLTSAQKVVNWFLDAYYWKNKETPFLPAPGAHQAAKIVPSVHMPEIKIDLFQAYENDLSAASSIAQIEIINKEAQQDRELTAKQKQKLELRAKEISRNLDI